MDLLNRLRYDFGTHTVCAKMDKKFLDYTASKGNDLSSVVNLVKNGVYAISLESSLKMVKQSKVIENVD